MVRACVLMYRAGGRRRCRAELSWAGLGWAERRPLPHSGPAVSGRSTPARLRVSGCVSESAVRHRSRQRGGRAEDMRSTGAAQTQRRSGLALGRHESPRAGSRGCVRRCLAATSGARFAARVCSALRGGGALCSWVGKRRDEGGKRRASRNTCEYVDSCCARTACGSLWKSVWAIKHVPRQRQGFLPESRRELAPIASVRICASTAYISTAFPTAADGPGCPESDGPMRAQCSALLRICVYVVNSHRCASLFAAAHRRRRCSSRCRARHARSGGGGGGEEERQREATRRCPPAASRGRTTGSVHRVRGGEKRDFKRGGGRWLVSSGGGGYVRLAGLTPPPPSPPAPP